uniref:Uncharacterized protein n=1 Tax=Nelumbo nucifera TaxID=4432 RepID=A0A822YNG4_NELNU|nr:TPA_asm: hypothetical protein HUJ06_006354 [Nelumbo nucifera]
MVIGPLPPLLHLLGSESERVRHDSTLALYHLSLVQCNCTKLVKMGSMGSILTLLRERGRREIGKRERRERESEVGEDE